LFENLQLNVNIENVFLMNTMLMSMHVFWNVSHGLRNRKQPSTLFFRTQLILKTSTPH